ncbi:MAG: mechanosensitive ion channel [Anaerolineales bacterium]|nr:mechanosensitive ion channel [Anaerolineales bacterium]MCB8961537.1 mechanosensitive ion channel [Ardenticatenales bacterium]
MLTVIREWLLNPTVVRLLAVLAAFVLLRLLVNLLNRSWNRGIKDKGLRYQARKVTNFVSYFLLIVVVAFVFSDQLSGLAVAFGVATAGIAFALQEVITSFAGWLAILAGDFYKTGDRVQLGGITGDIIDIGVLRTTIMETGGWVNGDLYNGRTVRVANSFVFKEPVYNYSGGFPFLWDEIVVPIRYGSDRALAEQIMIRVANEISGNYTEFARQTWADIQGRFFVEDAEIAPMVTMVFNDNWLEYTIRYVVEYKRRRSTKDLMSRQILDAIDGTGGKVAIASTTMQLVEPSNLNVALTGR